MIEYIARMVLVCYDSTDRHIGDSDLDNDQPIALTFRCKLGDIRKLRRSIAMIDRSAEQLAADLKVRREYNNKL
jgi:hypothetical protein